jgi:hypothetical protein
LVIGVAHKTTDISSPSSVMISQSRGKSLLCGSLLIGAIIETSINEALTGREVWDDPSYSVFLFLGDLLLLLWMWGVSIQVWRRCGIPWAKLLGLTGTPLAKNDLPEHAVYETATDLSIVYLATFVIFNWASRNSGSSSFLTPLEQEQRSSESVNIDESSAVDNIDIATAELGMHHILPPALLCYFAYISLTPWIHKKVWWQYLYNVSAAPFYMVTFRCGYVGDILTSLVRVLAKALYSILYVIQLPIALTTENGLNILRMESWWKSSTVQDGILPWLMLFPLWIRLMQCLRRSVETGHRWPHIANALKYTSAIAVVGIGALAPNIRTEYTFRAYVWVIGFVCATIYQFCWDITMDWGLLVPGSSPLADKSLSLASALASMLGVQDEYQHHQELSDIIADNSSSSMHEQAHPNGAVLQLLHWCVGTSALRKKRLLGPLWIYLTIMISNLILRFAWTLTLLPNNNDSSTYGYSLLMAYLTPVIAAAEVLRRMVWGFLRLEWEHIEIQQKAAAIAAEIESTQKEGENSNKSTGDCNIDSIQENDSEEGPFIAMGMNALDDRDGPMHWFSHWLPSMPHESSTTSHQSNGSTLYNAADPNGTSHILKPILTLFRTIIRYVLEGIACIVQRAYVVVSRVLGCPSETPHNSNNNDDKFRRMFNDASWFIAPIPRVWSHAIAIQINKLLTDKVLVSTDFYRNTSEYSRIHHSEIIDNNDDDVDSPSISKILSTKSDSVDVDMQEQLIVEALMFALLLLAFLFLIAFL